MNYLAPFRSRSEAFRMSRALNERHIASAIINTPRSLGVSCGLTVVFDSSRLELVKELVSKLNLVSSQGIFRK